MMPDLSPINVALGVFVVAGALFSAIGVVWILCSCMGWHKK